LPSDFGSHPPSSIRDPRVSDPASRLRRIYHQHRANAELINRHVAAIRLQHGTTLTRRGLSELGYALGFAGFTTASAHSPLARVQAGELAEARHEERLNAKKPAENQEISYAKRMVLLKIADRVLCGP
jgi:hypothetical protein